MSLDKLVKIHQLQRHTATSAEVQRLLEAAVTNLEDSRNETISDSSRFDIAYKAITQCALVALLANGYRPSTTTPGHHQTMIQSLSLTLGIHNKQWIVLDSLRKKRHLNDYSGAPIEPGAVHTCIAQAAALLATTRQWVRQHRPELLSGQA